MGEVFSACMWLLAGFWDEAIPIDKGKRPKGISLFIYLFILYIFFNLFISLRLEERFENDEKSRRIFVKINQFQRHS